MTSGSRRRKSENTIDAFHRGRFWLVQPAGGHRAGLDAMILASAVPSNFDGYLADLGAGAGAAGLAVLSRCRCASALLVENNEIMSEFAARSLTLDQNRLLAARARVLTADVTLSGASRKSTGLDERTFDYVIMNPPFNDPSDRASPDPIKKSAHTMSEGGIEAWIRTAAAILKPEGGLAMILRPASLAAMFPALAGRFGGVVIKPVHARPATDAIRIVIRCFRGSRKALAIAPPLVLHGENGNAFTAEADALINGNASLFGD